jgi:hypothetical protein
MLETRSRVGDLMTSNTNRYNDARAYQREHGVNFTAALRAVQRQTAQPQAAATSTRAIAGQARRLTIAENTFWDIHAHVKYWLIDGPDTVDMMEGRAPSAEQKEILRQDWLRARAAFDAAATRYRTAADRAGLTWTSFDDGYHIDYWVEPVGLEYCVGRIPASINLSGWATANETHFVVGGGASYHYGMALDGSGPVLAWHEDSTLFRDDPVELDVALSRMPGLASLDERGDIEAFMKTVQRNSATIGASTLWWNDMPSPLLGADDLSAQLGLREALAATRRRPVKKRPDFS